MSRRIFCPHNCYSPLKDTHTGKFSRKVYLSLIAFLSLKLSGQECISCFWFLKAEKRDSGTCNTEKSPALYHRLKSQFFPPKKICRNICFWAGTTSTELVTAFQLPAPEGTRERRAGYEKYNRARRKSFQVLLP